MGGFPLRWGWRTVRLSSEFAFGMGFERFRDAAEVAAEIVHL